MFTIVTNEIYHSKAEHFLPLLDSDSIQLTVTSPPYDQMREYDKGASYDFPFIASELYRVTKPGGIVVWVRTDQCVKGSESGTSFKEALGFMDAGFNLYDTMIYKKKNYMVTNHKRYEQEFEYMFILSKGMPSVFNPIRIPCIADGRENVWHNGKHKDKVWKRESVKQKVLSEKTKGNIWEYSCGKGGSTNDMIAFEHPAIFQEQLAADHIYSWSNPGDIVLDIFSGSGTTPKMALLNNRKYLACDASIKYVVLSKQRLQPYINQKNLFTND